MATLGDMTPSLSSNNVRNRYDGNAIFGGKHLIGNDTAHELAAYLLNLRLCEFGLAVLMPARGMPFLVAICHILCVRTKPKMRGIHTSGIVFAGAIVANRHAFWDRAIVQYIAKAMRLFLLSVNADSPISIRTTVTSPLPTAIGGKLIYVIPEVGYRVAACTVAVNKANWLTLYPANSIVGFWRNLRLLPATAMAVTVWDFVRGIMWIHRNLLGCGVKCQGIDVPLAQPISMRKYSTDGCFSQGGG
jgi:hypothetical protein